MTFTSSFFPLCVLTPLGFFESYPLLLMERKVQPSLPAAFLLGRNSSSFMARIFRIYGPPLIAPFFWRVLISFVCRVEQEYGVLLLPVSFSLTLGRHQYYNPKPTQPNPPPTKKDTQTTKPLFSDFRAPLPPSLFPRVPLFCLSSWHHADLLVISVELAARLS